MCIVGETQLSILQLWNESTTPKKESKLISNSPSRRKNGTIKRTKKCIPARECVCVRARFKYYVNKNVKSEKSLVEIINCGFTTDITKTQVYSCRGRTVLV